MNNTLFLQNNILPIGVQCTDITSVKERYIAMELFLNTVKDSVINPPLVIKLILVLIKNIIVFFVGTSIKLKNVFINKSAPTNGPPVNNHV